MRPVPLIPTVLVGLACAAMIALGVWQLRRADEKAALLTRYEQNRAMSADVMFPILAPVPDEALFRHSRAVCLDPVAWRVRGGRATDGTSGFRYIAECRTGAEGPGLLADMGVSPRPDARPQWRGGMIGGVIALDPDQPGLIARMIGNPPPPRALLIADQPASGLKASARPNIEDIPNNHFAYAVQWFLFAVVAAAIYLIALWRRR